MKITKSKLKQIIKEELASINEAEWVDVPGSDPASLRRLQKDNPALDPDQSRSSPGLADDPRSSTDQPDPEDIQILQAIKELLEVAKRPSGPYELAVELRRLAKLVSNYPEFDTEEPETSDVEPLELPPVTGVSHKRMRQSAYRGKHGIK